MTANVLHHRDGTLSCRYLQQCRTSRLSFMLSNKGGRVHVQPSWNLNLWQTSVLCKKCQDGDFSSSYYAIYTAFNVKYKAWLWNVGYLQVVWKWPSQSESNKQSLPCVDAMTLRSPCGSAQSAQDTPWRGCTLLPAGSPTSRRQLWSQWKMRQMSVLQDNCDTRNSSNASNEIIIDNCSKVV